jgi:hypothetical protein
MPQRTALITSLILERPLCLDCISMKANATLNEIEAAFQNIESVLVLRSQRMERCRACGMVGVVFSLERLPSERG